MTVRFYPGTKQHKTRLVAGFLTEFHVDHELVQPQEFRGHAVRMGTDPAVEVDGTIFVDPNVDALRKILLVP